jgi:membrane fusion protein, multidrug efflux system
MRKPLCYGLSALVLSLVLITGCRRENQNKLSDEVDEHKTNVKVIPAKRGNLSISLSLTGTLAPFQEVKITSKIPGRVEKVNVEKGATVKHGDILIELEQEELVLGVKQAKAALASADAHLADTKNDYKKMKNLYEEKSIPGQRWEKIQAGLKVAEAQVEQAKAALALTKKQLANAAIRSPIDGIITNKFVEPGEVVSPPMMPGMPLLQIMKLDILKTMVNISEKRVNQVHVGQEAEVKVDGLPGRTFSGKISKVAPVVDHQNRTFEIEINIPNPEFELKAGMFARVSILLEGRSDVLLLPLEAILDKGKDKVIFVAQDNVAQQRTVTVGLNDGANAEIISGVKEGEKVIVKGNLGIEEDTKIIVESLPLSGQYDRGGTFK